MGAFLPQYERKETIGNEQIKIKPVSPYGITKYGSELVIQYFREVFGLSGTVLRLFSVYGPNQRNDMAYSKITKALSNGSKIEIFGNGKQIRTNTYIDDVVSAFWAVADRKFDGYIFNVSGEEPHTLLDFIEIASDILEVKPKLSFIKERVGDQIETRGDSTLLKIKTG